MIGRTAELAELRRQLRRQPLVAIIGPRQVGKTTLARALAAEHEAVHPFDLEDPRDLRRLGDEATALVDQRGLVIIDEVQRRPDLFPMLRVLADRPRRPATFLLLGSASPHLLKQSSETLAGRITYFELGGFSLADTGSRAWRKLWLRGGFPRSFLARSDAASFEWRSDLRRTYVDRDLPAFGPGFPAPTVERMWEMLVHYHGQVWNASELARSFGVAHTTVRRYLDLLVDTFMLRLLPPWSENRGKRVVKSPKVYFRDSGLAHLMLGIRDDAELRRHPKVGATFEGFALEEVVRRLGAEPRECFFWGTHQGAELDLLVVRGGKRHGFEFKHTLAPELTRSMKIAIADLELESLDVVHLGKQTFPLTAKVRALSFERLHADLEPL
jgi:predicted AAA+ superfamily ATPase